LLLKKGSVANVWGRAQRHLIGLPSLLPGFGEACNKRDRLGQSRGADAEGALDAMRQLVELGPRHCHRKSRT
jgi:hypothetical protein